MKPHGRDRLGQLRTVDAWERVEGSPSPLGATWVEAEQAWNFALYSRFASGATLLVYGDDVLHPLLEVALDPVRNKSATIWHYFVPESLVPGAKYYAWRIDGVHGTVHGQRFDVDKVLLDPFAQRVHFPRDFSRAAACSVGKNDGKAPLGVLPRLETRFDWQGTARPRHSHDTIVYELHVKGFTARENSGISPDKRGTFLGLIEKIPYLQELGVTVVELLPVHQFDPQEGNYWGYMTLNFFAPHHGYATGDAVSEFRQMVRAFHHAGIEVWLDVVYNHTAESGENGPTYSFRGIDNDSYYLLTHDLRHYMNDTGCGNTVRTGHPA